MGVRRYLAGSLRRLARAIAAVARRLEPRGRTAEGGMDPPAGDGGPPAHWRALRAPGPPDHWVRRVREAGLSPPQEEAAPPSPEEREPRQEARAAGPARGAFSSLGQRRSPAPQAAPATPAPRREPDAPEPAFTSAPGRKPRSVEETPLTGRSAPAVGPAHAGGDMPARPTTAKAGPRASPSGPSRAAHVREEPVPSPARPARTRSLAAVVFGRLARRLDRLTGRPPVHVRASPGPAAARAGEPAADSPTPVRRHSSIGDAGAVWSAKLRESRRNAEVQVATRPRSADAAASGRLMDSPAHESPPPPPVATAAAGPVVRWTAAGARPRAGGEDAARVELDWPPQADDTRWAALPEPPGESADRAAAAQRARERAHDDLRREQARL